MNTLIGLILIGLTVIFIVLLVVFIITNIQIMRSMKHKGQYRLCNDGLYHWREEPDPHPVMKDPPVRNCK